MDEELGGGRWPASSPSSSSNSSFLSTPSGSPSRPPRSERRRSTQPGNGMKHAAASASASGSTSANSRPPIPAPLKLRVSPDDRNLVTSAVIDSSSSKTPTTASFAEHSLQQPPVTPTTSRRLPPPSLVEESPTQIYVTKDNQFGRSDADLDSEWTPGEGLNSTIRRPPSSDTFTLSAISTPSSSLPSSPIPSTSASAPRPRTTTSSHTRTSSSSSPSRSRTRSAGANLESNSMPFPLHEPPILLSPQSLSSPRFRSPTWSDDQSFSASGEEASEEDEEELEDWKGVPGSHGQDSGGEDSDASSGMTANGFRSFALAGLGVSGANWQAGRAASSGGGGGSGEETEEVLSDGIKSEELKSDESGKLSPTRSLRRSRARRDLAEDGEDSDGDGLGSDGGEVSGEDSNNVGAWWASSGSIVSLGRDSPTVASSPPPPPPPVEPLSTLAGPEAVEGYTEDESRSTLVEDDEWDPRSTIKASVVNPSYLVTSSSASSISPLAVETTVAPALPQLDEQSPLFIRNPFQSSSSSTTSLPLRPSTPPPSVLPSQTTPQQSLSPQYLLPSPSRTSSRNALVNHNVQQQLQQSQSQSRPRTISDASSTSSYLHSLHSGTVSPPPRSSSAASYASEDSIPISPPKSSARLADLEKKGKEKEKPKVREKSGQRPRTLASGRSFESEKRMGLEVDDGSERGSFDSRRRGSEFSARSIGEEEECKDDEEKKSRSRNSRTLSTTDFADVYSTFDSDPSPPLPSSQHLREPALLSVSQPRIPSTISISASSDTSELDQQFHDAPMSRDTSIEPPRPGLIRDLSMVEEEFSAAAASLRGGGEEEKKNEVEVLNLGLDQSGEGGLEAVKRSQGIRGLREVGEGRQESPNRGDAKERAKRFIEDLKKAKLAAAAAAALEGASTHLPTPTTVVEAATPTQSEFPPLSLPPTSTTLFSDPQPLSSPPLPDLPTEATSYLLSQPLPTSISTSTFVPSSFPTPPLERPTLTPHSSLGRTHSPTPTDNRSIRSYSPFVGYSGGDGGSPGIGMGGGVRVMKNRPLPEAMRYAGIRSGRTSAERAKIYALKINALAREDSGMGVWIGWTRSGTASNSEKSRSTPILSPTTKSRHSRDEFSTASFPSRGEGYRARELSIGHYTPSDPVTPYPGVLSLPRGMGTRPPPSGSAKAFFSLGRKNSKRSPHMGGPSGGGGTYVREKGETPKSPKHITSPLGVNSMPIPPGARPIGPRLPMNGGPGVGGGSRMSMDSIATDTSSSLGVAGFRGSMISYGGSPVVDQESLDILCDTLPHLSREVLEGYLRRAGGDETLAVTMVLSDESQGRS